MKYILLAIFISIYSTTAFTAEYRINAFDTKYKNDENFLELSLKIESGNGDNLSKIFDLLNFCQENFSIRILGLPLETRKELNRYYEDTIPEKLNAALKSSGNLHNPTLEPLADNFKDAFKNTRLYKEIETILNKKKYRVSEISFEKFTIESGVIFVADIWIECKRSV